MNIIEGIQEECKRLREVSIPRYESIGPEGMFGVAIMKAEIQQAKAAIASGDVVRMITVYKKLKDGWQD